MSESRVLGLGGIDQHESRRAGPDGRLHRADAFQTRDELLELRDVARGPGDVRPLGQPVVHDEQRRGGRGEKSGFDELKSPRRREEYDYHADQDDDAHSECEAQKPLVCPQEAALGPLVAARGLHGLPEEPEAEQRRQRDGEHPAVHE